MLSVSNREPRTATEPPNILFIVFEDNDPGLDWFEEIQSEGGYRAYYAVLGCGSLQAGGTPVGLGMDQSSSNPSSSPRSRSTDFSAPGRSRITSSSIRNCPPAGSNSPSPASTIANTSSNLRVDEKSVDVTLRLKGTGPLNIQLPEGDSSVIELH